LKNKILFLLKLIFIIFSLPFLYFLSASLIKETGNLIEFKFYIWGMATFTFFYIFFWNLEVLFKFNKSWVEHILKFLSPFIRITYHILYLPGFVLIFIYKILSLFWKADIFKDSILFFSGFLFFLHFVNSCNILRPREWSIKKFFEYLFSWSLVYFFFILSTILCFLLLLDLFPFIKIFTQAGQSYIHLWKTIYSQLFLF